MAKILALFAIIATLFPHHYVAVATVVEVSKFNIITAETVDGELWRFVDDGYEVGDTAVMLMYDLETEDPVDDIIVDSAGFRRIN